MKKQKDKFEPEATPVAISENRPDMNTPNPVVDTDNITTSSEWDDDKTEILIDSNNSENDFPSLITEDGAVYVINRFPFLIGREHCDLQPKGKGISRKHAKIFTQFSRFVIKDLDSSNGVKVNGHPISQVLLENNDSITIGDINFTFKQTTEESSSPKVNPGIEIPSLQALREIHSKTSKKPYFKMFGLLTILISLGYFGFTFYKVQQKNLATPKAPIASINPVATPTKPSLKAQVKTPSSTADTDKTNTNKTIAALKPPPKPTAIAIAKPAAKPAAKKTYSKPSKPSISTPSKPKSQTKQAHTNKEEIIKISSHATQVYIGGDAARAINILKNADVSGEEIPLLYFNFNAMHTFYEHGSQALKQGQKDNAMSLWTEYLADAKKILPNQTSPYQKEAISFLIEEYKNSAVLAEQNSQSQKAYIYWQTLYDLTGDLRAKAALDDLNNQAKDLFRNGLRQEYINVNRAIKFWEQVLTTVPPGNIYYEKARIKLNNATR